MPFPIAKHKTNTNSQVNKSALIVKYCVSSWCLFDVLQQEGSAFKRAGQFGPFYGEFAFLYVLLWTLQIHVSVTDN